MSLGNKALGLPLHQPSWSSEDALDLLHFGGHDLILKAMELGYHLVVDLKSSEGCRSNLYTRIVSGYVP